MLNKRETQTLIALARRDHWRASEIPADIDTVTLEGLDSLGLVEARTRMSREPIEVPRADGRGVNTLNLDHPGRWHSPRAEPGRINGGWRQVVGSDHFDVRLSTEGFRLSRQGDNRKPASGTAQPESEDALKNQPVFKLVLLQGRFAAARFNVVSDLERIIETRRGHIASRDNLLAQLEGPDSTLAEIEEARRRREALGSQLDATDPVPPYWIEPLIREQIHQGGLKVPGHLPELESVARDVELLLLTEVIPPFKKANDSNALDRCRTLTEAAKKLERAAATMAFSIARPAVVVKIKAFKKCLARMNNAMEAVAPLLSEPNLDANLPSETASSAPSVRKKTGATQKPGAGSRSEERPVLIEVDVERVSACVAGQWCKLTNRRQADMLKAVLAGNGAWVPSDSFAEAHERPDRLFKKLPKQLRHHIEGKPGSGYRFVE